MILIDTGVLVALVNRRDANHEVCRTWFLETEVTDLMIPAALISEIC